MENVRETVPEEPLPEYLAALWDFAEGKSHSPKTAAGASTTTARLVTPPATPVTISEGTIRQSRRTSSSSSSSSSSSFSCDFPSSYSTNKRHQPVVSTAATSKAPPRPPSPPSTSSMSVSVSSKRPASVLAAAVDAVAASTPGQALEDATALCAFMEAAQTRSVKRSRVAPPSQQQQQGAKQQQTQPRGWSDHGSTTSESRGGSDFSEEDSAFERKSADGNSAWSSSEASAALSPAFWTSRQVLERYVLPRQQLPQG